MTRIQRIRRKILDHAYYLSSHAEAEMLDDRLERRGIENAILKGRIQRKLSEDIRGVRYRIEGLEDGRLIHVIRRFKENSFLIIQAKFVL